MARPEFSISKPAVAEVIKARGTVMRDEGYGNYNKWWDPDQIDEHLKRFSRSRRGEHLAGKIDGVPAVAAIVQTSDGPHLLDDYWKKAIAGGDVEDKPAHYMYYVTSHPDFAGQRLVDAVLDETVARAQKSEVDGGRVEVVRLDTVLPEVRALYERYGMEIVHEVGSSALYELVLPPAPTIILPPNLQ